MNYVTISLLVLLGIVSIGWLTDHLTHKGIDVSKAAKAADKVLSVADTITDAIAAIAPCPATTVMQKIVDAAKVGVNNAEQLHLNGSIPAEQRKPVAVDVLKRALALDGIAYEGDVAKLGDAAMEAAVRALPKTGDVKVTPVASITPRAQLESTETPAASDDSAASNTPETPKPSVTIDQLNQAQTIISAAIAEKTAAQVPTECETAASVPTNVGQASV
jgi:hypothetical protein